MGIITQYIGVNMLKTLIFAALLFMAYQWANGGMAKQIAKVKRFKAKYGVMTMLLVILWWLLTPSGLPDDFITLYLIDKFGFTAYVLFTSLLTVYLTYRMKVTLVIYK